MTNIKNKPKLVSLFSGAGGMDLGFKQAGFDIIFANDFDKDACETYKKNIDDNILHCDISIIKNDDIPKNIDVLIGGFPCQGFSIANKNRNIHDSRNSLYKEMIRFITVSKPKIIVAENVKGILSLGGGVIFQQIKKDLENLNYRVDYFLINFRRVNLVRWPLKEIKSIQLEKNLSNPRKKHFKLVTRLNTHQKTENIKI